MCWVRGSDMPSSPIRSKGEIDSSASTVAECSRKCEVNRAVAQEETPGIQNASVTFSLTVKVVRTLTGGYLR